MINSTMLRFLQVLPEVSKTGDFILKDLSGSGKRIDILCRDLAACFDWGLLNWPISQLEFIAIIGDTKILRIQKPVRNIPIGERAWAQLIQNSLKKNPPDYVTISEGTLDSIISELRSNAKSEVWVLHEHGTPLKECKFNISGAQNSFMLGDQKGFDSKTDEIILRHKIKKVSLGSTSYLSSHCVASVISEFERMV